jgi:hypothetical protein
MLVPLSLLAFGGCSDIGISGINTTPEATISSHGDGQDVPLGEPLQLVGQVFDEEDDAAQLRASWLLNGLVVCAEHTPQDDGFTACETTPPADASELIVTLQVLDPDDAFAEDTVVLTQEGVPTDTATGSEPDDSPPWATLDAPLTGDWFAVGTPVACAGEVGDDQDDATALAVLWTSSLDGVLDATPPGPDGSVGFATLDLSAGAHTLTLGVTDSDGETASATVAFTVNSPPTAAELALTPDSPLEGVDPLLCTVVTEGVDPEGTAVTHAFAWDVDGVPYTGAVDAALASDVDGSVTIADETWTCTVTASDGQLVGPAGTASVVVVSDGPGVGSGGRTFVTSTVYDGDLGGLSGADSLCQDRADAAGLGGSWAAWLSDSSTQAVDRLATAPGAVTLVDGTTIAASWTDLLVNSPSVAIEVTEYGSRIPYESSGSHRDCSWAGGYFYFPWTGTHNDGTQAGGVCDDWTSNSSAYQGRVGLGGYSVTQWTNWCDFDCDRQGPLYCFEQ